LAVLGSIAVFAGAACGSSAPTPSESSTSGYQPASIALPTRTGDLVASEALVLGPPLVMQFAHLFATHDVATIQ